MEVKTCKLCSAKPRTHNSPIGSDKYVHEFAEVACDLCGVSVKVYIASLMCPNDLHSDQNVREMKSQFQSRAAETAAHRWNRVMETFDGL